MGAPDVRHEQLLFSANRSILLCRALDFQPHEKQTGEDRSFFFAAIDCRPIEPQRARFILVDMVRGLHLSDIIVSAGQYISPPVGSADAGQVIGELASKLPEQSSGAQKINTGALIHLSVNLLFLSKLSVYENCGYFCGVLRIAGRCSGGVSALSARTAGFLPGSG